MKHFKESDFIEHLSKCSFDSILEIDDSDEALLAFLNIFTEVLNHHAPIIKRRVKYLQQNEWMNDEIRESIRKRDFYHKKKICVIIGCGETMLNTLSKHPNKNIILI